MDQQNLEVSQLKYQYQQFQMQQRDQEKLKIEILYKSSLTHSDKGCFSFMIISKTWQVHVMNTVESKIIA